MNNTKQINQEVALNYIDKIAVNIQVIGRKLNRTIGFLLVCSLILLGLNYDIISISNKIPVLGLEIQVSESIVLIIMCICCYLLQAYMFGLGVKESENIDVLANMYKKLGFYDESMNLEDACLIEYPTFITISFSRRIKKSKKLINVFNDSAFMLYSLIVLIIAPIVFSLVSYGTVINKGISSWESIVILGILVLSIINFISGFTKGSSL